MTGLVYWLDMAGVIVFALSGVILACRSRMDPFGMLVLAAVTGIGGGTLRDLVLGVRPVFWVGDPAYLWVILATVGLSVLAIVGAGLAVGAVNHEAQRLIVALTVLSLMFGPLWLVSARRFHNILLLGVTSARETLRLAYGKEAAFLFRPIMPSASVVDIAANTTRWTDDAASRKRP